MKQEPQPDSLEGILVFWGLVVLLGLCVALAVGTVVLRW